ncbi:MAG: hypothetical protein FWE37_01075 [Spirochaetaceae bacterium]|nr:hypothetical protein [Spirochaetaceae bacterium]
MTKILPSGAELQFAGPPFNEAVALLEAVLKEGQNFNLTLESLKTLAKLNIDDILTADSFNQFKTMIIALLTSPQVLKALKSCGARALYNNSRLNNFECLEEEDKRQDYFFILFNLAGQSLAPFFKGLAIA